MSELRLGHAHLKVRDLERSVAFYTRTFGLRVTEIVDGQLAFLSGTDVHHEIALQQLGASAPASLPRSVGLYHVAFEAPDKAAFARAFAVLVAAGVPVSPVDHLISWALYFDDPDGNGLELYVDTRGEPDGRALWHGENRPLTVQAIRQAGEQMEKAE